MAENEIIYLGIDLGTSRTSITSSNGVRETVWSYVGYPKDHVAKKKMGGKYAYTPILIDMKQQSKSTNWWFNASVPFSSHIGNDGQPTDVNMLFEAGEVKTYKNEQVKLGADMGGWWFYYDPF